MNKPRLSSPSERSATDARRIVVDGRNIRDRVHTMTAGALYDGTTNLGDVARFAGDVLRGAKQGLDEAMPADPKAVLNQVVDGMSDAIAAAADQSRVTFMRAKRRTKTFVKSDMDKTVQQLSKLETSFVHTIETFAESMNGLVRDHLKDIAGSAKRAGTKIGPSARAAIDASRGHGGELLSEAAGTSVRAARKAAGAILAATSGALQAAGEAVEGSARSKAPAKRAKAAGTKKKSAKKTRKKVASRT